MRLMLTTLFFLNFSLPGTAQGTDLPEEARIRIDYLLGTWDVYDEILNEDGDVIETSHAINHTGYFLGDSVLVTSIIPDQGPVRKTIRFFDKEKEVFYEISVGMEGDLFILSGDLDEYVMNFTSRAMRDGVYPRGRFHHINIEPNSFEATMEVSMDGGETWTKRTNRKQRLVRRTNPE